MARRSHHVVVGGGQAGACAVKAMRETGFTGDITLIGGEQHVPYERPSLSKEMLSTSTSEPVFVCPQDWYREKAVELLTGVRATSLDLDRRIIRTSGDRIIPFDRLLLTTGARPRPLLLPGSDLPGVTTLRTLDDARALRRSLMAGQRLVVIGGGLIGLEVAAAARRQALQVTVLEAAPELLGRVAPPEIAALVAQKHRAEGVQLLLGTTAIRFLGEQQLRGIELADGSTLPADLAVVGIGILPETVLAEAAGLDLNDGILIDEHCRTSDPDIFAAGDCARQRRTFSGRALRLENWTNARNQAVVAARNMCGASETYWEPPWGWSQQFDMLLQFSGAPAQWDRPVLRRTKDGALALQVEDSAIAGAAGINCAKDMLIAHRMVGSRRPIDVGLLADPARSLKSLLKSA